MLAPYTFGSRACRVTRMIGHSTRRPVPRNRLPSKKENTAHGTTMAGMPMSGIRSTMPPIMAIVKAYSTPRTSSPRKKTSAVMLDKIIWPFTYPKMACCRSPMTAPREVRTRSGTICLLAAASVFHCLLIR